MMDQNKAREVFRRTGLAVAPEWMLAGSVALAIGLAAGHFDLLGGWEGVALMSLPLIWAGGRTLQWLCHTWVVTADGRLLIGKGVLLQSRHVIHLCSVSEVRADASPASRWLRAGHVSFEATGQDGLRSRFHWTWVRGHERLGEILQARGRLPIGRPTRWETAMGAIKQGGKATFRSVACTLNREELQDYGRFMAFAHRVLRADRGGQWPPVGMRPVVMECWMGVLRDARVVSSVPNERGWRVLGGIESLDAIQHRIGPGELELAVRRLARLQLRWAA